MSQRTQIKNILSDGQRHCSVELIEKICLIDYRSRISELIKREGLNIKSEPCNGRCGRNHSSGVHRYWIADNITERTENTATGQILTNSAIVETTQEDINQVISSFREFEQRKLKHKQNNVTRDMGWKN